MLDEAIATCEQIADGLGAQNQAWEDSVTEIVEKFGEVSDTFFFKTMPSIPVTRKLQPRRGRGARAQERPGLGLLRPGARAANRERAERDRQGRHEGNDPHVTPPVQAGQNG